MNVAEEKRRKIVITGAPGTGKTVLVEGLEAQGFTCYHEIIRTMTAEAKKQGKKAAELTINPLNFVEDPMAFNRMLLEGRLAHYETALKKQDAISFFDRGLPDVLAYMDYFEQEYPNEFLETCDANRYDTIFMVPPWKEIYVSDNERLETYEQAEELHHHLVEAYQRFGYKLIMVPKTTIPERIEFVLNNVT
ncbi:ATPase [Croceivirga radicis]|uniref:ATPase n=1 Tax=Croceivirga radicis TaxID=1929488 RepID=A0A1V6LSS5_9FLAO|nr:ATP-binding protein [Croceivirga radicis]OQD43036.1 ATPase [Croceivirga radicis]